MKAHPKLFNMNSVEIRQKLIAGNREALKLLIEKKKKENSYLVLFVNGKVEKVKARDIKLD